MEDTKQSFTAIKSEPDGYSEIDIKEEIKDQIDFELPELMTGTLKSEIEVCESNSFKICDLPPIKEEHEFQEDVDKCCFSHLYEETNSLKQNSSNFGGIFTKCSARGCYKYSMNAGYCVLHEKTYPMCKNDYCCRRALTGGFCIQHGGTRSKCKKDNCGKFALKGGYCVAHGGTYPKCKESNCSKRSMTGGYCVLHKITCKINNCSKCPLKDGFCLAHVGSQNRKCNTQSCLKYALNGGYCVAHRTKQS